jgi:hypothetical protein
VVGVLGTAILVGIAYFLYTHNKKKIKHHQVKQDDLDQTIKRSDIESPNKGHQVFQEHQVFESSQKR